jgi:alpha-D-xyloside xylohydrolase
MHLTGTLELAPDEQMYGLGEKFGPLGRRGRAYRSFNQGIGPWTEGDHKNVPLVLSSRGYGLFFNTSYPMLHDVGSRSNGVYAFAIADSLLDLYFIAGSSYKEIISRYTEITGRPELPPPWSLGIWMSRWTYKSSDEVLQVAREFRRRKLPCDVMKIDTGWFHREGRGSPCDFDMQWNRELWPEPEAFMAELRRMGFRTALFVDPHVLADSPLSHEARAMGYLQMMPDGAPRTWELGPGCPAVAFDLTNQDCRRWYKDKLKGLLEQGASTFFADWGIDSPPACVYAGMDGLEHNNAYGLLYNSAVSEAVREHSGQPAAIWGISGYAGSQRYPTTYGGDSRCTFRDMASVLRGGLSAAMSGILFYGCDTGGYGSARTPNPDETLYIRYLQHGLMMPFAQFHGMGPREPWHYGPRAVRVYDKYARLRYRLLPYIVSQAYLACRDGVPMLRPMVLDFQDDPNTASLDMQYMFGESLLVAPVFGPQTRRSVYLPQGQWYDYNTGKCAAGPGWLDVRAPLEVLPLFVRAGSVVPMGPELEYVDQAPLEPLTLDIFPPAQGMFEATIYHGGRECPVRGTMRDGTLKLRLLGLSGECHLSIRLLAASAVSHNRRALHAASAGGMRKQEQGWRNAAGGIIAKLVLTGRDEVTVQTTDR